MTSMSADEPGGGAEVDLDQLVTEWEATHDYADEIEPPTPEELSWGCSLDDPQGLSAEMEVDL